MTPTVEEIRERLAKRELILRMADVGGVDRLTVEMLLADIAFLLAELDAAKVRRGGGVQHFTRD